MTTATVNEFATGAWAIRVGEELEVVGLGLNPNHTIMRRPGERRTFGLPTHWLDMPEPEPECCPTCGRELEES
jgi:hypothetical protein